MHLSPAKDKTAIETLADYVHDNPDDTIGKAYAGFSKVAYNELDTALRGVYSLLEHGGDLLGKDTSDIKKEHQRLLDRIKSDDDAWSERASKDAAANAGAWTQAAPQIALGAVTGARPIASVLASPIGSRVAGGLATGLGIGGGVHYGGDIAHLITELVGH